MSIFTILHLRTTPQVRSCRVEWEGLMQVRVLDDECVVCVLYTHSSDVCIQHSSNNFLVSDPHVYPPPPKRGSGIF